MKLLSDIIDGLSILMYPNISSDILWIIFLTVEGSQQVILFLSFYICLVFYYYKFFFFFFFFFLFLWLPHCILPCLPKLLSFVTIDLIYLYVVDIHILIPHIFSLFLFIFKSNLLVIRCYWNSSVKSSYASSRKKLKESRFWFVTDIRPSLLVRSVKNKRIECIRMLAVVVLLFFLSFLFLLAWHIPLTLIIILIVVFNLHSHIYVVHQLVSFFLFHISTSFSIYFFLFYLHTTHTLTCSID